MKFHSILNMGIAAGAALLSGCASEMPDDIAGGAAGGNLADSCIEIFAGQPSGTTRAVNEPSRPGVCDADKVRLWFFEGVQHPTVNRPSFSASDLTLAEGPVEIKADRYGDFYAQNKLASRLHDFTAKTGSNAILYHYTTCAVPALAYTETDASKFTTEADGNYTQLNLSLTSAETPELYFGRLSFPAYNSKGEDQMDYGHDDGMFSCYQYGYSDQSYPDCPVNGKLYRIVSQMNIVMKDVPEGEVEKMELLVSDFPTRMTLFGEHGAFYHVQPASTHIGSEENYISVATCDRFHNGEARLSTFLLPSDLGYKMRVRVWYPAATVYDKDGNEVRYKDCDVRPANSSLLTGDDAEVYFSGAADHLKAGDNALYVYNDFTRRFYSYANVRVNINGDFDKVLREVTTTNIQVEVCPTFQKDHIFEID